MLVVIRKETTRFELTASRRHIIKRVCIDVGCDNLAKAERNRQMVAEREDMVKGKCEFWERMEKAIAHTPKRVPLPSWIPQADIPVVSRADWRQNSGGDKHTRNFIIE